MNNISKPDITIIIINYNVKEFLANCLRSVENASDNLKTECIVVDNASTDGSIEFLKSRFKNVRYIENSVNYGFGKANNQAIRHAKGKYTLLLNPDTLLQEDTLRVLIRHMEEHEECGACGCKIVNPDGTFAPESRRTVPTLSTAVYKALGLTALFPKSRIFGVYYQGWKDEDEPGEVPVLSGSFMFFRTEILKETGGFDERFFMYGEDIDLCYRIRRSGWKIHYVPDTSIIHYKGESSKQDNMNYVRHFNRSLYLFFDKHYSSRYSSFFRAIVFVAILIRSFISVISVFVHKYRFIVYDITLLNLALFISYAARFQFDRIEIINRVHVEFLWLNLILTLLYVIIGNAFGIVKEHRYSIVGSLKAVVASFLALAVITFFIKALAFSRIILVVSGLLGFIFVGLLRIMRLNFSKNASMTRGRFRPVKILVVGVNEDTENLLRKLRNKASWQVEIIGIVHQETWNGELRLDNVPVIGSLSQLSQLIRTTNTDQIHFLMKALSYSEILESLVRVRNKDVEMKIVSDDVNFILGKSNVEYLDNFAVLDIELSYFNSFQQLLKRFFDLTLTVPIVFLLAPVAWPLKLYHLNKLKKISAFDGNRENFIQLASPAGDHKLLNFWLLSLQVVNGKLSTVGSSLGRNNDQENQYRFKAGWTGYWQIHRDKLHQDADKQRFDIYYLQNYSIWLDFDILVKSITRGSFFSSLVENPSEK